MRDSISKCPRIFSYTHLDDLPKIFWAQQFSMKNRNILLFQICKNKESNFKTVKWIDISPYYQCSDWVNANMLISFNLDPSVLRIAFRLISVLTMD